MARSSKTTSKVEDSVGAVIIGECRYSTRHSTRHSTVTKGSDSAGSRVVFAISAKFAVFVTFRVAESFGFGCWRDCYCLSSRPFFNDQDCQNLLRELDFGKAPIKLPKLIEFLQ